MKGFINNDRKKAFEKNILISYIRACAGGGTRFFIPVLALFYVASQVSLAEFSIILSVFSLSILLLEIPTGVIADLLGKKKTLIIANGFYVLEVLILILFNGFWPFLIAKIISGIGVSLNSGTSSALIYDSLKRIGREKEHKKISGKITYLNNISWAFVFIIGAYLFNLNYKLPAIVSLPFIVLGFVLAFFYTEPYKPSRKFNLKNSYLHLKEGIIEFKKNNYLVYIAFFTLIIGSTISMTLSLSSAYYEAILIPIALIGVIAFLQSIFAAYSSKRAHEWEAKLGEKKSMFIIQGGIVALLILMGFMIAKIGALFLIIISFISGFYSVITGDYVNRHVESSHRATMLSINNMFDNIGEFLIFPVLGFGITKIGMGSTFFVFGVFVFLYLIALYFVMRRLK